MATISDIKSYTIVDENITANVGDTNLTLVTTDFHEVDVIEVASPAQVAIVDIGVVGLGNSGGGSGAVDSVNAQTGAVILDQDDILDGTTHKQYSATEKTKLAGIATGATANDTDANLKNRANHTGSQAISTITNLQTTLDGKAASSHTHAEADVTGLTAALAAKAADADLDAHTGNTSNPHGVTKAQVGLGNVDNTADSAKPVSTAQQTALDGKQPLDSDLTAIAGLAPTNDDILQRKAGAWTNRTIAQLKTDLALAQSDVSGLTALLALGFYYADGTTSTNARPSVPGKVLWVGGTTQPVNMATGDLWIKA